MPPMLIPGTEPDHFTLNVSGIAGFLGGEEAISAMESVHFYKHRKYLGFYNAPGSYNVAKHYGRLAKSPLWDGLYPGVNDEPAKFLKMDGERGPKFIGTLSGTTIGDIEHIGYILGQMCRHDLPEEVVDPARGDKTGTRTRVTIVQLDDPKEAKTAIVDETDQDMILLPPLATISSTPLRHAIAIATMLFSIGACVVCGIFQEWYAFALILLGIFCNGFACFEIGSAKIYLKRPNPSTLSPPGHGVINDRDSQLIVLRGTQTAVNYITMGKFIVRYGSRDASDSSYHRLGLSATALTFQFIAQLFLIPQSGLFGQIIFLSTLAVSWINNACFSSIDKEALQKKILKSKPFPLQQPNFGTKYSFPTRTAGVVFAMLQALPLEELRSPNNVEQTEDERAKLKAERVKYIRNILESLLPKGPDHWEVWMDTVATKVSEMIDIPVSEWSELPFIRSQKLEESEPNLLDYLLRDANLAVSMFRRVESSSSQASQVQGAPNHQSEGRSPDHDGHSEGGPATSNRRNEETRIQLDVMGISNGTGT